MMGQARRRFSRDFKSEVVKLVLDGNRSVSSVAKDYDLHESSLYGWVRQARADLGETSAGLTTEERAELSALRREVRELRREKAFLEEAASYFARVKK